MPKSRALAAALFAAAAVACKDLTAARASLDTLAGSDVVFPLNGSPASAPNALSLAQISAVRADANMAFDVAFNLDSTGKIRIVPIRLVTSQLASAHSVGLQALQVPFDSVKRAPKGGYVFDSVLVVARGQPAAFAVNNPTYCFGSLISSTFYGKLVVDSVDAHNALHVRITTDPNCGFYDLTPGIPAS